MSIYKRGENYYIDFTFKGQRVRESIGPSSKGAEKVIPRRAMPRRDETLYEL